MFENDQLWGRILKKKVPEGQRPLIEPQLNAKIMFPLLF